MRQRLTSSPLEGRDDDAGRVIALATGLAIGFVLGLLAALATGM